MNPDYPSADALIAEAQRLTGLSDFGETTFREGLEVLLASLAADVPYAAADRAQAVALILRRLSNRLRIEAWFAAHPGAEDALLEAPVSILGLPRTGTTALGNMMSRDVRFRSLRAWEQQEPVPPPVLADEDTDPRRLAYRAYVEALLRDQPEQGAMHLWDADATMEDTEVLGLEFRAQQMTMPVFGYHAWWREGDMRAAFRYHARVARLLQSARPPNRWLFKAPHHKFHLLDLVAAYPDINLIFTHRDPVKAVPSYASFVASLYPADVVRAIGKPRIGREIHNHLLTGMRRAVAARAELGEHRFLDVHHRDFVADPMRSLEGIYDWLGTPLTPEVRAAFEQWHRENRSGAHGDHSYTPEEYGLTADQIAADYAFYSEAFGILR